MMPISPPAAKAVRHFPVVWEEAACPLCGYGRWSPFAEAPDPMPGASGMWFAVVRCERCGLRFTNPRPAPSSIGQFYPADYDPHRRPRPFRRLKRWYPLGVLRGRASERRSLPWLGQGRLLDFGCGSGGYLARMAEQGWDVTGLDASVNAVDGIHEQFGLKALVGSLPHPDLKPGSFDVVTMWHSLEHVHDPLAVLRETYQLLVPQGRLVIAVPNIESWPYRWFGRAWYGLDLPRHLTHFCPHTLPVMLECAGFRVESLRMLRHSDWLCSSARNAARQGPPGLVARLLRFKSFARLAAWSCFLAGKSDCLLAVAERAG